MGNQSQPVTAGINISNAAPQAILDIVPGQLLPYVLAILVAYPFLVSLLRFRRVQWVHQKFKFPNRASLAKMTDDEAWEIQKVLLQLEFPFIYIKALQFALFRVRLLSSSFFILFCGPSGNLNWPSEDLRNPQHLRAAHQDQPILESGDILQALRRYKRLGPGVYRQRPIV